MRTVETIVAPTFEPVTRAEARLWMRLTDTTEDDIVDGLIKAMRERAETITGRAFAARTLRVSMDCWPIDPTWGPRIDLPMAAPIRAVGSPGDYISSFTYLDTSGVRQNLSADLWQVNPEFQPAFIIPSYGSSWPALRHAPTAVQVTYYVGYDSTSAMPEEVRLWMKARAATMFEFREQIVAGSIVNKLPADFTDGLLDGLVLGSRMF